jgi:hypothetical protein
MRSRFVSSGRSCWIQWPQPGRMTEPRRSWSRSLARAIASLPQRVGASTSPPMKSAGHANRLPCERREFFSALVYRPVVRKPSGKARALELLDEDVEVFLGEPR